MKIVTYEIGKKLQEKKYPHDYNDFGNRLIYSDECTIKFISNIGAYERGYYGENIPCPTINEVLDWLRVEKKIHITIRAETKGFYWWEITDFNEEIIKKSFYGYKSYEYAAIAGIEYVLNNLI